VADPYIDPSETQVYGPFAREQMKDVCMGRIKELDGMVKFAIAAQADADAAMKDAFARQPSSAPPLSEAEALAEARDVITRFGAYLLSLKGRPVDPAVFFQGEAPSVLARRRITKLAGALAHIVEQFDAHKSKLRDAKTWAEELTHARDAVKAVERLHRASRVERTDLAPDLSSARDAWLATYAANKSLIRGLLAHLGKPELLPLVFDDLAESHRASGVVDGPGPAPEPPPAPVGGGAADA
jgi:hypothetical protein